MTTPGDVEACAAAGADAVGVNFFPGSPRYVDPRQAAPVRRAVPPLLSAVGVFVNQPLRQIAALAYQLGLHAVQVHGDQHEIADPFPFSLIAAFRVRDASHLDAIKEYVERCTSAGYRPGAILVDAWVEGQHGGTGYVAPWDLVADFRSTVPLILAGGLTPDNVAEAIRIVRPAAVDVASGVESTPGRKDHDKIRAFIANARNAAAKL